MTPDQPDQPPDRRARVREAAVQEIKQVAREHLLRYGAGELSLRAVARDVGVTPSALYRYFDSRGALVAALSADALESAEEALGRAARDEQLPPLQRLRAMFLDLRGWARTHQSEFELVFANRDDSTRPDVLTSPELQRLLAMPVSAAMEALAAGTLQAPAEAPALGPVAREAIATLLPGADDALVGRAVLVCVRCLGWLHAEHFGLVGWALEDGQATYALYLDGVLGRSR